MERGGTKTKHLDKLAKLGIGRSRLYQFVQLLGSLCGFGGAGKPEECRSRAFRHQLRVVDVRIPDRLHAAGACIWRSGRPPLAASIDCHWSRVLELRNRAFWICG